MLLKSPRIYYTHSDYPDNPEQLDPFVANIVKEGRHSELCMYIRGGPEQAHIESVKRMILLKLQYCLGTEDTEYLKLYHGSGHAKRYWVLYESSEADLDSWYGIVGTYTFIETVSFILNAFERLDTV